MSKYIKDDNTVLVWDGVPYILVREEKVTENCPCHICDLCDKCNGGTTPFKFIDLCIPANEDDRWFFKTDWEIADNRILDYLDFNPE